jgi:hypothetical protein
MESITFTRVKQLAETNHVVALYPRKQRVSIDGGRCMKIKKSDVTKIKALKSYCKHVV